MERRTAIVAAVVLLLGAVVAIQLADPRFGERTPPEVNFSEPPAEVAADAAAQFEYVDYAYKIELAKNRTGTWRQVRLMEIDHSSREYYKEGPAGENGVVLYGTDAVTFVRPGVEAPWQVTHFQSTLYSANSISQPFLTERLQPSDATVISNNASFLVVRLDSHSLNVAENFPGNSTLYINKNMGLIERAYVSYNTPSTGTRYLRFEVLRTEISTNRPEDITFSLTEFAWDFLRGPLFHV